MRRSPGVCGDRGFVFRAPEMRMGKGACQRNQRWDEVFRAQVNVFATVPLAQRNTPQKPSEADGAWAIAGCKKRKPRCGWTFAPRLRETKPTGKPALTILSEKSLHYYDV